MRRKMLSIIIGGSGSGKSAFAEELVCRLPGQRFYIATMTARDPESLRRIAKHRLARAGYEFQTLEWGLDLAGKLASGTGVPAGANVLLEDLSNLLANEMFRPEGGGLRADGVRYDEMTDRYLRNLALLNRELAQEADLVTEIVCGLPNVLKGVPV